MTYFYAILKPIVMVKSKTELFELEIQVCAQLYKALSHPARIAILKYLAETKTCITGDISDELPLSRSTVNQHLAELKKAGLIQGHIEGVNTKYCLNPESIKRLKKISIEFLDQLDLPENFIC
jgi:ArsR family transcriptional regulator